MIGLNIPRVSRDQATIGTAVSFQDVQAGDLIFFATGTPNYINHVGVISEVAGGEVKFIHASSSKGVMESSMSLDYWRKAYMTARRVLA
jgi:cell wall-associated NlpC family hydrolase